MIVYFVDTSALGRRYLPEIGSAWVSSWIVPSAGNVTVISELAVVEMLGVFARVRREGKVPSNNINIAQSNFLLDVENEYLPVLLERPVMLRARSLIANYPLRALDSVQLACAVEAVAQLNQTMIFVSGDQKLLVAAASEGFATDNPYLHP